MTQGVNELYFEFMTVLGLPVDLDISKFSIDEKKELVSKMVQRGLPLYISNYFGGSDVEGTNFIANLNVQDISPFDEIFQLLGYDFTKSNSDSPEAEFFNMIKGYIALGLWVNIFNRDITDIESILSRGAERQLLLEGKYLKTKDWDLFLTQGLMGFTLEGVKAELLTEKFIVVPDDKCSLIYQQVKGLLVEETEIPEQEFDKLDYARELAKQGFKIIDDETEVANKSGMFSKTLDWLKTFCTEKEYSTMGYRYLAGLQNQDILIESGIANPKEINIWNPSIFQLDEDLQFRLFVREDNISFTVLIKLPLGLRDFEFKSEKDVNNISFFFSNLSSGKGETYQSSIMQQPRYCTLKATRQIDTPYDVIEIVLAKDLLGFKNSNWGLVNYIKACNGKTNEYSDFRELSLGERIVVGVKPGGLKAEKFDCSGKFVTSGIIGGQAGSGKTALFDSLLLQFLALSGDYGDGAVILLDAKQEWVPAWRSVFNKFNVPFYGFDGSLLKNQDSLKQQVVSRGGKVDIQGFKGQMTLEVAGIIFVRTLYEIIQSIQKEACNAEDIKDFNKAKVNYHGITKIPRTAILVDEINTLHNFTKNDPIIKSAFELMTSGANLTRTSGYMWLLGGQNPSKTIIPSKDVGSLGYNIFGTMSDEIYEYFNVVQNKDVVRYEEVNGTSDVPHPIMTQGMFYAGKKGKTELVKCLYVDKSERALALELLGSHALEGMKQLDKIVRFALDNHMFDNYTFGVGGKNNLIFAALRDIGVMTEEEFIAETDRLFNGSDEEINKNPDISKPSTLSDILSEEIGNIDNSEVKNQLQNDSDKLEEIQNKRREDLAEQLAKKEIESDKIEDEEERKRVKSDLEKEKQEAIQKLKEKELEEKAALEKKKSSLYNEIIKNTETKSPLTATIDSENYSPLINMQKLPFNVDWYSDGVMKKLVNKNETSKYILNSIVNIYGDLSNITSFRVNANGVFSINNSTFTPKFPESFYTGIPLNMQDNIRKGSLVKLFNFYNIRRFKNLQSLEIENSELAIGQCKTELGIPKHSKYNWLFKKFHNLHYICISGVEYRRDAPDFADGDYYENRVGLGTRIANMFGLGRNKKGYKTNTPNPLVESVGYDIWESRPVRVVTNAFGWTMGVKAITLAATLFGPWGLLFGALTAAGAYKEIQEDRVSTRNNSNKQKSSNSSNKKRRKKDSKDDKHNEQWE